MVNKDELEDALDKSEPCYNGDPELWTGNWVNSTDAKTAEELCAGCHVYDLCRQYALDNKEPEFIWGGTRPVDRVKIAKRRRPKITNSKPPKDTYSS